MTESDLNKMSTDDLFGLMVKAVNELVAMNKSQDHLNKLEDKQQEVELIQRVIVAKRASEIPLK